MTGSVCIYRSVLDRVHDHARAGYPLEVCGLLLGHQHSGRTTIIHAVSLPNAADPSTRHDRFAIDPRLMLQWERQASAAGLRIAGVFHSHPDAPARPSGFDLEAAWPGYVYLIVCVSRGLPAATAAWTLDESAGRFVEHPIDVALDEPDWVI
jgi:proteasome lid subunit RPN8/RPN11